MFKSEENAYIMSLLESPRMGNPIIGLKDELKDKSTQLEGHIPIGKYGIFNLYKVDDSGDTSLWLINPDNDYPSLYYKFKECVKGEYIITDKIFGDENYKGLFSHFFSNFVLKLSVSVESDKILTKMGCDFWIKMFKNTRNYFYILDLVGGKLIRITNEKDFSGYYGADESFANYKFIISTIPRTYEEIIRLRRH